MSPLEKRLYETAGPKRILTLDGGGIRGALTLGFLEKIEEILRERYDNPELRLCEYFDLIAGTSTGGIIAAALAKGMTASEIKDLYLNIGGTIFGTQREWWLPTIFRKAKYDHRPLEAQLLKEFGDLTIGDQEQIKTGLCIVAKRADTFSAWPMHNFPRGKYYKYNKDLLVRDLLRATSAAPSYFIPKVINVGGRNPEAAFIDGGVSLANNPSFQALMLATLKGYSLNWPMGRNQLFVTSIGTGTSVKHMTVKEVTSLRTALWGAKIPDIFMEDASFFNQTLMQWLSNSQTAIEIDSEIGDLRSDTILGYKPLSYNRYNMVIDKEIIKREIGMEFTDKQIASLCEMDKAENRYTLAEIGNKAAAKFVRPEHFPPPFDPGADTTEQALVFSSGSLPKLEFSEAIKKPIPIRVKRIDRPFQVETLEGLMQGQAGDYLAVGVRGEMYPIQGDIFKETYDIQEE